MAYADDLIVFAREMAELYPSDAHQPSLRRAVSTAYYALFHLLISDAVAQCPDPQFRAALARVFEHGLMKSAFDTKVSEINSLFDPKPLSEPERTGQFHLHNVAETFSQAQHNRLDADYNLVREWQPGQVSLLIEGVERHSPSWNIACHEQPAKNYLLSMLPTRERKQPQPSKPGKPSSGKNLGQLWERPRSAMARARREPFRTRPKGRRGKPRFALQGVEFRTAVSRPWRDKRSSHWISLSRLPASTLHRGRHSPAK